MFLCNSFMITAADRNAPDFLFWALENLSLIINQNNLGEKNKKAKCNLKASIEATSIYYCNLNKTGKNQ